MADAVSETILVLNAGSSSIKFELFSIGQDEELRSGLEGQLDGIATRPRLVVRDGARQLIVDEHFTRNEVGRLADAIRILSSWLHDHLDALPAAVGHRVVHGGPDFAEPVFLTDQRIEALHSYIPLAPLHQPNNLAPIKVIRRSYPDLAQVACFDTAFHRGHGELADRFAIPEALYREGIRRYGFHGLSYEFIASQLPEAAPDIAAGKVVVAHLGSGASLCAIVNGRSVESTMSFTALDGLPMGTRPGRLDPGVVLYLMEEKEMPAPAIGHFLYRECGLKGLSGVSNDVRDLLASEEPGARLALDFFSYRIAQEIGALAMTMGGLDGLVFTAGVGENASPVRRRVAEHCRWLGLELDNEANSSGGPLITRPGSRIAAYVIPTDEERMIALHTLRLLRAEH